MVTENVVDSRRLADETLRAGHGHPGVVFATSRRFPRADPRTTGRMIRALATLLAEKDDLENQEHFLQQASQSD